MAETDVRRWRAIEWTDEDGDRCRDEKYPVAVTPDHDRVVADLRAEIARLVVWLEMSETRFCVGHGRPLLVCEQHPELAWPHGDCAGPGMLCSQQVPSLVQQRNAAEAQVQALREALEEALKCAEHWNFPALPTTAKWRAALAQATPKEER